MGTIHIVNQNTKTTKKIIKPAVKKLKLKKLILMDLILQIHFL